VGNLFPNPFAKQALVAYSDAFMVLQVFGITDLPEPSLDGNILPNPVDPKTYMVMLCYKNGSLTREDVRNRYADGSWDVFNKHLENTAPLNGTPI
jgi:xylulokinase